MEEREFREGLTFDDILLVPSYSRVTPGDVDVSTRLTEDIILNIPILSAAMDTVTDASMGIAIAQEGGLGVIHKNLSVSEQADEVSKVKKYESGIILEPLTLHPDQRLFEAVRIKKEKHISGLPVVKERKVVGILTNRDLRFQKNMSIRISDVMTKRVITAPVDTTLDEAKEILYKHRIEKLPVVDDEGYLKGLITIKDIEKKEKFPYACKDERGSLRVGGAIGVGKDWEPRVDSLLRAGADVIFVDTAHGHSRGVIDVLNSIKNNFPLCRVVAGNVATSDATEALIKAGADAVKVGVGPGSICTTRIVAGVGVPQVTAVMECAKVAQKKGVPVVADGGIKFSGDIAKAIAVGADAVMIGGLFAGTDESPGETILYHGRTYKVYRGMGSIGAMKSGSADRYMQDDARSDSKFVPEGIEGRVPYKGPLSSSIYQLVGGLKAGMGYCGAGNIEELHKRSRFIRISGSGLRESHVHDVIITKEAPNYKIEDPF